MSNRLSLETSPYLLQHQHNPVDWYSWGEDAFKAARDQDKAIFLSVGYSTCYWCHVMERQCFESEAIAKVMNEKFINIKVDREERPDVDQLYMTAVQVMTRQGGWPMSVFLTPDLRPFFGGTYFPPEDAHGRPGFPRLLDGLEDAWKNRKPEVQQTADQLLGILHQLATPRRPESELTFDPAKIDTFITRSISDYDSVHGGYGRAPKFPRQTLLKLLLTYIDGPAKRDPLLTRRVRQSLVHTLEAMDRGGMHDHLGGGFHRYSTDERWLVPHFEIMLYDQAMLAEVYATASRIFENPRFAEVARGICDFVLREMTSTDGSGAFYTAFDAEVDHREGLNYLWTPTEISQILGAEDAALFGCVYGVDQGPNFADPHHGNGTPDANILFLDRPLEQAAHDHGIPLAELEPRLAAMRAKLKSVRDTRKQPLLDTKILTGWNALMASALALCGRELSEPRYTQAAIQNCRFLLLAHRTPTGGLLRTSRNSQAKYAAFLDDYAALAAACLATGDPELATAAQTLTEEFLERFGAHACHPKEENLASTNSTSTNSCGTGGCSPGGCGSCASGGLFFTDASADDLIVRQKVATDSPLPSGNALAASALLSLSKPDRAKAIFTDFAQLLEDNAEGMSGLVEVLVRYTRTNGPLTVAASASPRQEIPATPETLARSVVAIEARFGSETELLVRLTIREGFHINSPSPTLPELIPTRLELEGAETLYPEAVLAKLPFAPESLSVYQGQIILTVRFASPPTQLVRGALTYQPCDDASCLPPVTIPIEIQI